MVTLEFIFTAIVSDNLNYFVSFQEDAVRSDILNFIEKNQFPLVGHYNFNNEKKYNTKYPLCLVFYTVDWSFDYRKGEKIPL